MKKVKLTKDFSFSNDGIEVIKGKKGDEVNVSDFVYNNSFLKLSKTSNKKEIKEKVTKEVKEKSSKGLFGTK